ncbi:MAG TPA: DUF1987 domain-containing protein [Bacteroidales bacterium]|nr:DUF1987 domain-containing protein [Bacteroidales bacterium]HQB37449.1 DUF1987 domain-containing protein [Bacteroidales bacterium]
MTRLKTFSLEPTRRTPAIWLEPGRLVILGRSISENPSKIYRPVYEWIREYFSKNRCETSVELGFEYINTSSTKWIYHIIKKIADSTNILENTRIMWYYEKGDEDMCELGFILSSLVGCPFTIAEVAELKKTPGGQGPVILRRQDFNSAG